MYYLEKIKNTFEKAVSPARSEREKNVFKPFEERSTPIEEQFTNWNSLVKTPYDKDKVDAYTRTRVILMNGIENNSIFASHAMSRMTENSEIKRIMSLIRRADSQHQETVDWLNPGNQSILETTIGYEQVAVDLTANLAKNEPDDYFRQVLDYALLEDFDHLYRYSLLLQMLERKDPESIVQGKTEIKPGRPTSIEHRHPDDEMRMHFDKNSAHIKSWMNYYTIVAGEQQTMNYYRTHGANLEDDLARKLYAEIAEIEEQHVSQYEDVGDPTATRLQMATLIQLNEAYNYYSCAQTESNERIRSLWSEFCAHEIEHFNMCNDLMVKYEKMDIRDLIKDDSIEPLIVFEPNKEYVNKVLEEQVNLRPYNMKFVPEESLPSDWRSFDYQNKVNSGGVPSEIVEERWKSR